MSPYQFLYWIALMRVANTAGYKTRNFFDDVVQEAWVKFLRYHPRTVRGARIMAFSARADFLRKERTQREIPARIKSGTRTDIAQYWLQQRLKGV